MGNKIIKISNLNKTIRYLKKNGIRHAYYAAKERIEEERRNDYHYAEPSAELLQAQRRETADWPYLFSIVVPAYETRPEFLRAMLDSVRGQSYGRWELIIVDASSSELVEREVEALQEKLRDSRILYRRLRQNKGISENTNAGIEMASGAYIALLDHDDFLTPDALYHMAKSLHDGRMQQTKPVLLYSDEDKYDDAGGQYLAPHRKEKFNLDLIFSNNYICHFMAVEATCMKRLKLRKEYDGAQDYDLVLRIVNELYQRVPLQEFMHAIHHIPAVLYHWRCHIGSTAENTGSKSYAYEAGRKALEDFCDRRGWQVKVEHSLHLGFYNICYPPGVMTVRQEVGIVGGRILNAHKRICGGAYREDGTCMYEGLPKQYSGGSTHRAVLQQDVYAVDIRCMQVCPALREIFEEITGLYYRERVICQGEGDDSGESRIADLSGLNCDEAGYRKLSMELGRAAERMGLLVLWNPKIAIVV